LLNIQLSNFDKTEVDNSKIESKYTPIPMLINIEVGGDLNRSYNSYG
jgi:hypothetical protein